MKATWSLSVWSTDVLSSLEEISVTTNNSTGAHGKVCLKNAPKSVLWSVIRLIINFESWNPTSSISRSTNMVLVWFCLHLCVFQILEKSVKKKEMDSFYLIKVALIKAFALMYPIHYYLYYKKLFRGCVLSWLWKVGLPNSWLPWLGK